MRLDERCRRYRERVPVHRAAGTRQRSLSSQDASRAWCLNIVGRALLCCSGAKSSSFGDRRSRLRAMTIARRCSTATSMMRRDHDALFSGRQKVIVECAADRVLCALF